MVPLGTDTLTPDIQCYHEDIELHFEEKQRKGKKISPNPQISHNCRNDKFKNACTIYFLISSCHRAVKPKSLLNVDLYLSKEHFT